MDNTEMELTYKGFDTWSDAKLFSRFLETHGFGSTMIGQSEDKKLWKVYYHENSSWIYAKNA